MSSVINRIDGRKELDILSGDSHTGNFSIVICPPEFVELRRAINGEATNADHIILSNLMGKLDNLGHALAFIAPHHVDNIICGSDINEPEVAHLTWSATRIFDLASRGTWRIQQKLGVPYLNIFSNYRLYDACMHFLPGKDIVFERNSLYRNGIAMACKRAKIPYVLFFEADDILELDLIGKPITGLLRWKARASIRYNLKVADAIICVSEEGKRHLVDNWNVNPEKIAVFPNAVDVRQFRPDPNKRSAVRKSLALDKEPMILFVGSFYKWHDVGTLLEAFAQVSNAHPDAHLVLVGAGSQLERLKQQTADLGIESSVQFTGLVPHSKVTEYMAAADIAVVPYPRMEQELWFSPLKMFEYMASGIAMIASRMGQMEEVIRDGINGILVDPGEPSHLAAALDHLINNSDLRGHLGQQARKDMIRSYSWEHYISRMESLFSALIAGRGINNN